MCVCQYIKILNVCVSVCVTEVGSSGSVTRLVMHDIHTYTLYYVCVITSGRTRGAAAEALKQTQSGNSS